MKCGKFDVDKYGEVMNYTIEWISLDGEFRRCMYEKKVDAEQQEIHLDMLGRWHSGIKKIK